MISFIEICQVKYLNNLTEDIAMNYLIIETLEGAAKRLFLRMAIDSFFLVLLSSPTFARAVTTLTPTNRNSKGEVFWGKKRFSAVRRNLDDPPIHIPQNVAALADLNEITFARSSPYGVIIFSNL